MQDGCLFWFYRAAHDDFPGLSVISLSLPKQMGVLLGVGRGWYLLSSAYAFAVAHLSSPCSASICTLFIIFLVFILMSYFYLNSIFQLLINPSASAGEWGILCPL